MKIFPALQTGSDSRILQIRQHKHNEPNIAALNVQQPRVQSESSTRDVRQHQRSQHRANGHGKPRRRPSDSQSLRHPGIAHIESRQQFHVPNVTHKRHQRLQRPEPELPIAQRVQLVRRHATEQQQRKLVSKSAPMDHSFRFPSGEGQTAREFQHGAVVHFQQGSSRRQALSAAFAMQLDSLEMFHGHGSSESARVQWPHSVGLDHGRSHTLHGRERNFGSE